MLETKGKFEIVSVKDDEYVVKVENGYNIENGRVIGEFDVAYFSVFAGSDSSAFDKVADGRGEYIGDDYDG